MLTFYSRRDGTPVFRFVQPLRCAWEDAGKAIRFRLRKHDWNSVSGLVAAMASGHDLTSQVWGGAVLVELEDRSVPSTPFIVVA